MPDLDELERLAQGGMEDGNSVLSGALVRDLVVRNEDVIDALSARLAEVESQADEIAQAVRNHPAFTQLDPAVAKRLTTERAPAAGPGGNRPVTTVVDRPATPATPAAPGRGGTRSPTRPARAEAERPDGLMGRLSRSHWWWRIGVAAVVVALLLLKFG